MNVSVLKKPVLNPLDSSLFYRKKIVFAEYRKIQPVMAEFVNLTEEEEDPPLESDWHVAAMYLLVSILRDWWVDRDDIYVSGNTVVRFDPTQKRKFRGPDVYVVKNVTDKGFRRSWISWEENDLTPDFILELASISTAAFDVDGKKTIYEKDLKTSEYMVYNPDTGELKGWRLKNNRYQAITPNSKGWLWCEELDLWLGLAEYQFFKDRAAVKIPRFFDQEGQLVPTRDEAEAQRAELFAAQLRKLGINPDELLNK